MAKIKISGRKRADGNIYLFASIYINREKIRIPLDIGVSPKEWDPEHECVKGRTARANDYNLIIEHIRSRIHDAFVKARLSGIRLSKEIFLRFYESSGEGINFISYARHRLTTLNNSLEYTTVCHHLSVLKKLEHFNPNLLITDITADWLKIYAAHLRNYHGNNPATVGKNMSIIKIHVSAAIREGIINQNPFDAYRIPHSDPQVVYLTQDELDRLVKLYNSDRLPDNHQIVLRFFLFMTFTGMHISDARALQIGQIRNGVITYTRKKTRRDVKVPLSQPAARLVDFYKGGRYRGNLFTDLPSDQAFNRLIKIICESQDILKPVSAKAARHTFATLYYKYNNGDLGTLSKLLGHAKIQTTMIYAHILDEEKAAGVAAFNNFKL